MVAPAGGATKADTVADMGAEMDARWDAEVAKLAKSAPSVTPAAAAADISLDRSLGYHVRQLSESLSGMVAREFGRQGISRGQWPYLRELWEHDGLTQRELSDRVGRRGATTVVAIRGMESAGLVRIESHGADRRKHRVLLTALGRRKWQALAPCVMKVEKVALEGVTKDDIRRFAELLVTMQRNLDRASGERNSWAIARTEKLARRHKVREAAGRGSVP